MSDGGQVIPRNYKSDGASIPMPFWSFIGGPLSGPYRNASIVHDYFCDRRSIESDQVHAVFYEAMLASGVPSRKAYVMFKAVFWFGPNWERNEEAVPPECISGPYFEPTRCVLNADPNTTDTTRAMTRNNIQAFLTSLKNSGYTEEATQLETHIWP